MKHILITGGQGYIATELYKKLSTIYKVTSVSRMDFDLSDPVKTRTWFSGQYFDIVIHTAVKGGSRLVSDDTSVLNTNLKMYFNLLECKQHYGKLINIGSGAEIYYPNTMYGLSKSVIRTSLLEQNDFYNLRIFAIFDENELSTRFIKSNILRYMNKEPMVIHQNKQMDFFYMKDFISLVSYYINQNNPPKEINCSYAAHPYLSTITEEINRLSDYTVDVNIMVDGDSTDSYIGQYTELGLPLAGLNVGIQTVYDKLTCTK